MKKLEKGKLAGIIESYMARNELSQSELAERLGCNASAISKYLSGSQSSLGGNAVHKLYELIDSERHADGDLYPLRQMIWESIGTYLFDVAHFLKEPGVSDDRKAVAVTVVIDFLTAQQKAALTELGKGES